MKKKEEIYLRFHLISSLDFNEESFFSSHSYGIITMHCSRFISTLKIKVRAQQDKINLTLEKELGRHFNSLNFFFIPTTALIEQSTKTWQVTHIAQGNGTSQVKGTSSRGNVHTAVPRLLIWKIKILSFGVYPCMLNHMTQLKVFRGHGKTKISESSRELHKMKPFLRQP